MSPDPTPAAATPTTAGRDLRALVTRWALPAVWLLLPFLAGPALADALDPRTRAVQVVASLGLWLGWAAGAVALLVPRSVSLTALRLLVPAGVAATVAASLGGAAGVDDLVAVVATCVAAGLLLLPVTADLLVDGSSYGDERRFLLKTPGPLLLGPVQLLWAAVVAGAVAGPLLLAAGQWVAGGVAVAVGVPVVWFGARAFHGLSRRWVVFVPAGFVLHDLMAMSDALLLPRSLVAGLGPALAGSDATDLTLGSAGLALQVDLAEPVVIAPRPRGGPRAGTVEPVHVTALLFTPARPGALLHEAQRRRLRVG